MTRKVLLFILCMLPFIPYHNDSGRGPDIYLDVLNRVAFHGDLNTIPQNLSDGRVWQITPTRHAPIHQNIGGVVFFLPAAFLSLLSYKAASYFPALPDELFNFYYHEQLWVGCTTYLLALLFCLLTYRVLRTYFERLPTIAALIFSTLGGPVLVYVAVYPCHMHLPAAFVAVLLLYLCHVGDKRDNKLWLLMGAVWGLGVFVRAEFVVWGLLLLHSLFDPTGTRAPWRVQTLRIFLMVCGSLLFIIPGNLIRQVIFGVQGSTYGIQFDLEYLKQSYLMLFGTRNGLFTFWPVLLVALSGYFIQFRRNPSIAHVLFAIAVLEILICGSTVFWSGELGDSFGQRRFLIVLPCFIFFLARLFALCRNHIFWLSSACTACLFWALAMYCLYGERWPLPGDTIGFLMPYSYSYLLSALFSVASQLPALIGSQLLLPKHSHIIWLFPLFSVLCAGAYFIVKPFLRYFVSLCLAILVCVGISITIFLAGARHRGENTFNTVSLANPQALFVTRNYEIDNEIIGSMVDTVAFFLERGNEEKARYFINKTMKFLTAQAPDQIDNFRQMTNALAVRKAQGWYRLVPEQDHLALLKWGQLMTKAQPRGESPPDIISRYRYR